MDLYCLLQKQVAIEYKVLGKPDYQEPIRLRHKGISDLIVYCREPDDSSFGLPDLDYKTYLSIAVCLVTVAILNNTFDGSIIIADRGCRSQSLPLAFRRLQYKIGIAENAITPCRI